MFNNIVYFIIVLLIFSINHPDKAPKETFPVFLAVLVSTWLIFAAYCYWGFRDLQRRHDIRAAGHGRLSAKYYQLIARLSILAIFLFALDVFMLNLKSWILKIPGTSQFSFLQGVFALALFFLYLGTIWHFAHPAYRSMFRQEITRRSFVLSNFRINVPIIFPWMILSLVCDLIELSPWGGANGLLTGVEGNLIFFSGFIILLMIYMPGIIQYWWGCKPLESSEKAGELKAFLREKKFRYRHLLRWPIFEGRMMTAGIMGIVARFRYILITDSLMEILTTEELKAVLAHEMGHAKYRHLLFYVFFLLGFMVILFGLQNWLQYIFILNPSFTKMLSGRDSQSVNLSLLAMATPMLLSLIIYFRYIMGFFMRNFERQADLYSAEIMRTPKPTVSSLEKIAYFSGKITDVPSWHHFSIRQRIDCLTKTLEDPGLIRKHNKFVAVSFVIYLACIIALGYALNFSSTIKKQRDIVRYLVIADNYHETGKYEKAKKNYQKVIDLDPNQARALNNFAWLLITGPENLRDKDRALDLAIRAVALERSAVFLDTLATAYYENGFVNEAIDAAKEAIAVAEKERGQSISHYLFLANICQEAGKYEEAKKSYEKVIDLNPNQATALNNLAWLLVTAPEEKLRDKERALNLAKRAVSLERAAHCLDTLAEAYYVNGFVDEAVETIKEAIVVAKDNRSYYEKQLEKFLASEH